MAYQPAPVPYYGPNFTSVGNYPTMSGPQISYPNSQPPFNLVPGRMVNEESDIMASDVPMDGISIFPKSDGSKIFMKKWDGRGGIITTTYIPQTDSEETPVDPQVTMIDLFNLLNDVNSGVKQLTNKNNYRNNNKPNKQHNQNGNSEVTSKEDKDV